jgi:two-component system, chemotaxis family, chemotaxis protein CheY
MATILIVDDSIFIRTQLEKLLRDHGHSVILAEDGRQAIQVYRDARPDLVLMDITMPHMNGMDALSSIRLLDPRARVIILTALDQKLIATRAVHMGARDFLIKPVAPTQLMMAIQKVLR